MRHGLLVALLLGSLALAEDGEKPEKKKKKGDGAPNPAKVMAKVLVFEDYDKNRDGKLMGDELKTYFFDRSDVNSDGKISKEDFEALDDQKRQLAERLLALDRDGDGAVSLEEFQVPKQLANRLDTNKDGAISKEEADPNAGLAGGSGDTDKDIASFLERFDKNKDGKVGSDEYTGPKQIFDRVDTDQDGMLSRDEIAKFMQAAAKRGGTTGAADFVQRFDKNGDGKVTKEEFAGPETTFLRLDANGDGAITPADAK